MKLEQTVVGLTTIIRKQINRINRIWSQTLLPSAITLSLYFVIFGSLIGPRIGEMDGFSYMAFIVPGLIMMAIITNSYANVASAFFGEKFGKSIEELLVSPIPTWAVITGYVAGGVYRGLVVGIIVTLVSLFFTDLKFFNIFVVISTVVLTAIMFSLAGLLNAIFAKKFDDVGIVPIFVLTPLTYLGGVFYSISLLPTFWQIVSQANPILYMVNLFRYGFLGISDINIYFAYIMLLGFITVFYTLCYKFLESGYGMRS
jgi:ABC-2 type transport system permease protein